MVIKTKECFKNTSTFSWKPAVFICNFYWQTWRPVNAFLGISQKVILSVKRLCFFCNVYINLKGPSGRNVSPVAESPNLRSLPALGRISQISACGDAHRDRTSLSGSLGEVKVAARENRELELMGLPSSLEVLGQPVSPRGYRRKGTVLRRPLDRRGNTEVKQWAAGGARSTRSVGSPRFQLPRRKTGPGIRAPNPESSARSCPVALGFHALPPFLPLPPGQ